MKACYHILHWLFSTQAFVRLFCVLLFVFSACDPDSEIIVPAPKNEGEEEDLNFRTPLWSNRSHGNEVAPNYKVVFNQNSVEVMEITMTSTTWTSIQNDVSGKLGYKFGSQNFDGNPGTGGEPQFFPVSIKCNNREWYKVGFRIKGNSSLWFTWVQGIYKLPFRLKFDKFEDKYPQIEDQRFYGFQELTFSPGVNDNSLLREKVAPDIFRRAGIPAARTAFYRVYIDFGAGKKFCGVYTMVEVVDDTMVKDQFGENHGNIYKPESHLQHFNEFEFPKKNNENTNDYSDVKNFIAALNSNLRNTDRALWRSNLEATFNVNHFLRWLAVNSVMNNWDAYGDIAHNFYLYNHSKNGLTWIPWDLNDALKPHHDPRNELSHVDVAEYWPLIRYLIEDPIYQEHYRRCMKEFVKNVFTEEKMNTLFEYNHHLIAPYVKGPESVEQGKYTNLQSLHDFDREMFSLKQHVHNMRAFALEYLK